MGCGSGPVSAPMAVWRPHNTPQNHPSTSGFSRAAQSFAELAQREVGCGAHSKWISIAGSSSIRRLNHVAFVIGLHELASVGGWAAGGRDAWTLEPFAEMRADFPDRPRIGDERDQPNVTAITRALERKLLPHPRHELRSGNPRRIVGAGLWGRVSRVAAASCGVPVVRMPARRGLLPLADVPDRERRDGGPELVIGCKHPVVASRRACWGSRWH